MQRFQDEGDSGLHDIPNDAAAVYGAFPSVSCQLSEGFAFILPDQRQRFQGEDYKLQAAGCRLLIDPEVDVV